jgi:hypothetical protein
VDSGIVWTSATGEVDDNISDLSFSTDCSGTSVNATLSPSWIKMSQQTPGDEITKGGARNSLPVETITQSLDERWNDKEYRRWCFVFGDKGGKLEK